ncbi:MAG: NUDIX hydrolase [Betaproteobacteria bacterium]
MPESKAVDAVPIPLPAATVTLVRDAEDGLEVLMLLRNFQSGFMPGMYIFPGGALDPADTTPAACALCSRLDDAAASRLLRLERGGLAYWIAAIREAFEEAGILLACDESGHPVRLHGDEAIRRCEAEREKLNAGEGDFIAFLQAERLRLAADELVYFGHWITPVGAPRRYDTRFFIARAPAGQEPLHDNVEAIAHAWMRPQAALAAHAHGKFNMRTPTIKTLEAFSQHRSVNELIAAMRALHEIPAMLPRITRDGRRLLPGEPGYEEAASAEGRGSWRT